MAKHADATRFRTSLRSWTNRVADQWGRELAEAMRPEAPIGKVTPTTRRPPGELRESIEATPARPSMKGSSFQVRAPVIQARTTDKGARAHVIRARRAKVLRFWWADGPSGPGIYHFPRVWHPGNAPQNWWEPGLRRQARGSLRRAASRTRFR